MVVYFYKLYSITAKAAEYISYQLLSFKDSITHIPVRHQVFTSNSETETTTMWSLGNARLYR